MLGGAEPWAAGGRSRCQGAPRNDVNSVILTPSARLGIKQQNHHHSWRRCRLVPALSHLNSAFRSPFRPIRRKARTNRFAKISPRFKAHVLAQDPPPPIPHSRPWPAAGPLTAQRSWLAVVVLCRIAVLACHASRSLPQPSLASSQSPCCGGLDLDQPNIARACWPLGRPQPLFANVWIVRREGPRIQHKALFGSKQRGRAQLTQLSRNHDWSEVVSTKMETSTGPTCAPDTPDARGSLVAPLPHELLLCSLLARA